MLVLLWAHERGRVVQSACNAVPAFISNKHEWSYEILSSGKHNPMVYLDYHPNGPCVAQSVVAHA